VILSEHLRTPPDDPFLNTNWSLTTCWKALSQYIP